ncbi:MAG: DUF6568 family protein [Bacilli bacterium]
MAKKKSKKNIYSLKRIIYLVLIIIIIILLIWYAYSWYQVKNAEKYYNSYLLNTNTISLEIKDLDEVVQVLKESPNEYFVLISYTGNEETYNLEKKLKGLIDNYNLKDELYYINITSIKNDDDLYVKVNNTFNTKLINNVPAILYFKNNELVNVINYENTSKVYNEFKNTLIENGYDEY